MMHSIPRRRAVWGAAFAALTTFVGTLLPLSAQAQAPRPVRQPSESPISSGNSQTSKLPAGVDTGEPGTGQTPSLIDMAPRDKTRRSILRGQAAAAAGPPGGVDDSAAAKAAARPGMAMPAARPPTAASSPDPSRKRLPPAR